MSVYADALAQYCRDHNALAAELCEALGVDFLYFDVAYPDAWCVPWDVTTPYQAHEAAIERERAAFATGSAYHRREAERLRAWAHWLQTGAP